MKPIIVIPTYNEKENLEKIISEILALDCGVTVLVVDDNSPDGTGEIADRLASELDGQVAVVHRQKKEGLGPAYMNGFEVALDMGADYIFEMDADFSHNPRYIPDMLDAIKKHDVVIGSRYVTGGGTENWGLVRRLISRGGSAYARLLTGMKIRDCTAGFRCFRRGVIESIDFTRVSASGYGFQVELAYICEKMGYDVFEVPIIFVDRTEGTSKMSKSIIFEAMILVAGLKKRYRDLDDKKLK